MTTTCHFQPKSPPRWTSLSFAKSPRPWTSLAQKPHPGVVL